MAYGDSRPTLYIWKIIFYLILNAIDFFFCWKWPTSRILKKAIPPEGRSDFCWKWTAVLECRMYAWRTSRPAKISCGHLEPSGDFLRKACRTSMSRPTTNMQGRGRTYCISSAFRFFWSYCTCHLLGSSKKRTLAISSVIYDKYLIDAFLFSLSKIMWMEYIYENMYA